MEIVARQRPMKRGRNLPVSRTQPAGAGRPVSRVSDFCCGIVDVLDFTFARCSFVFSKMLNNNVMEERNGGFSILNKAEWVKASEASVWRPLLALLILHSRCDCASPCWAPIYLSDLLSLVLFSSFFSPFFSFTFVFHLSGWRYAPVIVFSPSVKAAALHLLQAFLSLPVVPARVTTVIPPILTHIFWEQSSLFSESTRWFEQLVRRTLRTCVWKDPRSTTLKRNKRCCHMF